MENNEKKTKEQEENEKVGKMSGLAGGVISGAAIGTSILPIVGTFAGAVVGGVVGSEVGKKYGGKLLDKFGNNDKSAGTSGEKTDVTAELQKLAKLHKDGVLSDDEFRAAKAQLLNL
ncbi:MAG TPA: SHOCT domain-containing protein [Pyrinomonadaceae bacterium]|jgi:outer membrane lipoprotein SlyB|nr:SHOCT domain-containing protein [Pyrinomonadaceae bacterium]